MSWAWLLKRVFDIDTEHCPNCGGALRNTSGASRLLTGRADRYKRGFFLSRKGIEISRGPAI